MDRKLYRNHINDVGKYIEHVILPELLSFIFVNMYRNNIEFKYSFYFYYNYYRRIINIKNINYRVVLLITKNILLKKYGFLTINTKPLIIEKIKES